MGTNTSWFPKDIQQIFSLKEHPYKGWKYLQYKNINEHETHGSLIFRGIFNLQME